MASIVSLRAIVDEIDFIGDESSAYLNKRTGELITLSEEEFSAAEEGDGVEEYPEWQQEMIEKAREVLNTDDYLALPTKFDIHEYRIMENFCSSVEDAEVRNHLLSQIRGRGAFRRFKDAVHTLGIEKEWYSHRDVELERIAMEWLEGNGIEYTRELDVEEGRT